MEPQKVYVNERDEAAIVCPSCGKQRLVDVGKYRDTAKSIRIRCSCKHSFSITLEKRKNYRKNVDLPGEFTRTDPTPDRGDVMVKDISRTGLGFSLQGKNLLRPGEVISLKFILDDEQKSTMRLKATVVRVSHRYVGVEFCDLNIPKTLAFYLMP